MQHASRLARLRAGETFVTDGGLETVLLFHDGLELPHFAAFDLLRSESGTRLALIPGGTPRAATPANGEAKPAGERKNCAGRSGVLRKCSAQPSISRRMRRAPAHQNVRLGWV